MYRNTPREHSQTLTSVSARIHCTSPLTIQVACKHSWTLARSYNWLVNVLNHITTRYQNIFSNTFFKRNSKRKIWRKNGSISLIMIKELNAKMYRLVRWCGRFTWERIVQRGCPCRDAENRDRENWEHIVTWTTRLRQLAGVGRASRRFAANSMTHARRTCARLYQENIVKISVYNRPGDQARRHECLFRSARSEQRNSLFVFLWTAPVTFHANYINR